MILHDVNAESHDENSVSQVEYKAANGARRGAPLPPVIQLGLVESLFLLDAEQMFVTSDKDLAIGECGG